MTDIEGVWGRDVMKCDLHIHSKYSFDGVPTLDAICRAAVEHHVDIIATTDHCDMTDGP